MIINANTTIATVLKQQPDALELIIGLHPRFTKLRNPLLRKLMAGRTTLAMAAKVAGIEVADFYAVLMPLGFETALDTGAANEATYQPMPAFMKGIAPGSIVELDVRPVIDEGKDPLQLIMKKAATLSTGQVLKIINSFTPAPLILMLEKRGFTSYVNKVNDRLVETYFYKHGDTGSAPIILPGENTNGYEDMLQRFNGHIQTIDVRAMEMPQPMLTILAQLESLPVKSALLVRHKRIPVFLLPELADRDFEYRIQETPGGSVNMIIYKD